MHHHYICEQSQTRGMASVLDSRAAFRGTQKAGGMAQQKPCEVQQSQMSNLASQSIAWHQCKLVTDWLQTVLQKRNWRSWWTTIEFSLQSSLAAIKANCMLGWTSKNLQTGWETLQVTSTQHWWSCICNAASRLQLPHAVGGRDWQTWERKLLEQLGVKTKWYTRKGWRNLGCLTQEKGKVRKKKK